MRVHATFRTVAGGEILTLSYKGPTYGGSGQEPALGRGQRRLLNQQDQRDPFYRTRRITKGY